MTAERVKNADIGEEYPFYFIFSKSYFSVKLMFPIFKSMMKRTKETKERDTVIIT